MRIDPIKLTPVSFSGSLDKSVSASEGDKTFSQIFSEALNNVNKLQGDAKEASMKLAAGQVEDISEVVIASEKASIALQLTMQVRNKVVDAYQEVMRMQV
jgi:flagellar hook-basal body complex protein FliE